MMGFFEHGLGVVRNYDVDDKVTIKLTTLKQLARLDSHVLRSSHSARLGVRRFREEVVQCVLGGDARYLPTRAPK
jgi:hypothetical protein